MNPELPSSVPSRAAKSLGVAQKAPTYPKARRVIARLIDDNFVNVFVIYCVFLVPCLVHLGLGGFWMAFIFAMFSRILLTGFFVESLSYKIFGTTLGKRILGLKLSKNGESLGFWSSFNRQRYVLKYTFWTYAGSPLFGCLAYAFWSSGFKKTEDTSYDQKAGIKCAYESIGAAHYIAASALVLVACAALFATLIAMKLVANRP